MLGAGCLNACGQFPEKLARFGSQAARRDEDSHVGSPIGDVEKIGAVVGGVAPDGDRDPFNDARRTCVSGADRPPGDHPCGVPLLSLTEELLCRGGWCLRTSDLWERVDRVLMGSDGSLSRSEKARKRYGRSLSWRLRQENAVEARGRF